MAEQNFIGIEIGGTKLQLAIADESLKIKQQLSFEVNRNKGANGIKQKIEESIHQIKGDKKVSAVGVGFGGPVNYKTGMINVSHQIAGWENFNLREWLQQVSDAQVFIDNDANVAALGEAIHGAGAGFNIVFYMTIGSGIGGGLIIDKKIYHGAFPGEAEVGHLRLNKKGETLESLCSGWAVDEKIRKAITEEPNSKLANLVKDVKSNEAKFLKEALKKNDVLAKKILKEVSDNIAFGLSHVVHLFHPEVIIIGGGLSLLGNDLSDAITTALSQYVMKAFLPPPEIKIASLGKNVVPVGALELARSSFQSSITTSN
jgi:glucokinase